MTDTYRSNTRSKMTVSILPIQTPTPFLHNQKKTTKSKLKKVNGSYQYPIRGRPLHNVEANDGNYSPNLKSVRGKEKVAVIGNTKKFFDVS